MFVSYYLYYIAILYLCFLKLLISRPGLLGSQLLKQLDEVTRFEFAESLKKPEVLEHLSVPCPLGLSVCATGYVLKERNDPKPRLAIPNFLPNSKSYERPLASGNFLKFPAIPTKFSHISAKIPDFRQYSK